MISLGQKTMESKKKKKKKIVEDKQAHRNHGTTVFNQTV